MHRSFSVLVATVCTLVGLGGCSNSDPAATSSHGSQIEFNEINAAGDDWIELYNSGPSEFDLSGYAIADTDQNTSLPRANKAMRFPAGSKLPAAGFALVLLSKDNSTPGPYAAGACLPGVAVGCYYALFSVSQTRGEAIHFLSPSNASLSTVVYPVNLEFEAGAVLTACRIPDGSGALTACSATPGAANVAR